MLRILRCVSTLRLGSSRTKDGSITRAVNTPDDIYARFIPADLTNAGDPNVLNPSGSRMHIGTAGGIYAWP